METDCTHLETVETPDRSAVQPRELGCEECLQLGQRWVHLRLCMACGHVGCCDESPGRHATAHFHGSGHPVIKSFEPGEPWAYCYVDEAFVEAIPSLPGESPRHHVYPPAS